jgi:hypothetical protein
MRVLTLATVAFALVASTAQAQIYVAEPAPVVVAPSAPVVVAPPASVVVAPPYVAGDYAYVPAPGATVVNPRTGRTCTIEPSGYRWCWTP